MITLEDIEQDKCEFDLFEASWVLTGLELEKFHAKYKMNLVPDDDIESCGEDGICRSFPGASFWYD